MMASEKKITNDILLRLSRSSAVRLFRNHVGLSWIGSVVSNKGGRVVLDDARRFHHGLVKGSSDLIGYKIVTVTQDMVGKELAVFAAVEVKAARGRTTEEQERFVRVIQQAGGIAGVARSPEEAARLFGV